MNKTLCYLHGLTFIPAWISNYIHHKVWNNLSITELQRLYRWSLEMDKHRVISDVPFSVLVNKKTINLTTTGEQLTSYSED